MSDQTTRIPDLWWSPTRGLLRKSTAGGVYVNAMDADLGHYLSPMTWNHLPADAVKLGDVEAPRRDLAKALRLREDLSMGYLTDQARDVWDSAAKFLAERNQARRERDALRADIRRVVTGVADLPSHVGRRLLALLDREPGREEPTVSPAPVDGHIDSSELFDDCPNSNKPTDECPCPEHFPEAYPWMQDREPGREEAAGYRDQVAEDFGRNAGPEPAPRTLLGWTVPDHVEVEHDEARGTVRMHCPKRGCWVSTPMTCGTRGPDSDARVYAFLNAHSHGAPVVDVRTAQPASSVAKETGEETDR